MFKKFLTILLTVCIGVSCVACDEPGNDTQLNKELNTYTYTTGVNLDGKEYKIVDNGVAQYFILLPSNPSETIVAVSTEFNDYIEDVSGVRLSVINEGVATVDKFISFGNTQAKVDAGIDTSNIKYDGFVIKTIDDNVYLAANIDRGVRYAAYSFLERFLGIRWLTASETYVPTSSTISMHECDIVEEPLFRMRLWMGGDYNNTSMRNHFRFYEGNELWMNYGKLNNTHNSTDQAAQPGIGWVNKVDIDPTDPEGRTLAETHPEYFSDASPNKAKDYELCFTNGIGVDGKLTDGQSVASLMIDKMKTILTLDAEEQQVEFMMIGHVDNRGAYCECDTCKERRMKYTDAGVHIIFLNAIEEEVNSWLMAEQGRKANLVTFAYQYTYNPPVVDNGDGTYTPIDPLVVANDNIYVRIAPIDANYTYSFNDPRQTKSQLTAMHGWAEIAKHFMLWDYVSNYVEYFWYFPNLYYIKENTELYHEMGVEYCMFQSSYTQNKIWHDDMRSYIASKLMWNLGWSVEELMNEYVALYYGEAQDTVKDVIKAYENFYTMQRSKGELLVSLLSENERTFLGAGNNPINWLDGIVRIIDDGMLRIQNDNTLTDNRKNGLIWKLEEVKLTPMRMILRNYDSYYVEGKLDYAIEFFDIIDAHGIVYLGETGIRSVATRKKECGLSV